LLRSSGALFYPFWKNWAFMLNRLIGFVTVSPQTSFLVLLNGCPFRHFRPTCGLRQGDPFHLFFLL